MFIKTIYGDVGFLKSFNSEAEANMGLSAELMLLRGFSGVLEFKKIHSYEVKLSV